MLKYWKPLTRTTKFSIIAFVITLIAGLFSMGVLGVGLYYLVYFLFPNYLFFQDWSGDWVWPTFIEVGVIWAFGFLIAGLVHHYLQKHITSNILLKVIYVLILWLWALGLWYIAINKHLNPIV